MVDGDVLVGHHGHLLVLVHAWDLLLHHCMICHCGGGRRRRSLTFSSSITPSANSKDVTSNVERLIGFTWHCGEEDGVARLEMNGGEKVGKLEWELMGLGMHHGIQHYMCSRCHSVVMHFLRKRFIFVSTTYVICPRDWGAERQEV
jgi:hypothetical protein